MSLVQCGWSPTFRVLSLLTADSIAGAIWRNTLPDKLWAYLPVEEQSNALAIFQSLPIARSFEQATAARDAITRSYRESIQLFDIAANVISVPNSFLMFFMRDIKLEEEDEREEVQMNKAVHRRGRRQPTF